MRVNVSLPDELLARVDAVRGDVARSLWLRRAVERALVPGMPSTEDLVATSAELDEMQAQGDAFRRRAMGSAVSGHLPTCRCPVCAS